MINMLLRRFAEYDYIVGVNEGELPFDAGRDHVPGTLKCAGCVAKSKLHTHEAINATMGRECRLIFACITNLDLLIFTTSV